MLFLIHFMQTCSYLFSHTAKRLIHCLLSNRKNGTSLSAVSSGFRACKVRATKSGRQFSIIFDRGAGAKNYKLHLPPNVPAKTFWSVVLYDPQTRSELQTDEQFPSLGSQNPDVKQNPDGSNDIYFGPKAPQGKEGNWVQTVPGKGWFIILRLYGPLEPWFDKTWQPREVELVK